MCDSVWYNLDVNFLKKRILIIQYFWTLLWQSDIINLNFMWVLWGWRYICTAIIWWLKQWMQVFSPYIKDKYMLVNPRSLHAVQHLAIVVFIGSAC